MSDQTVIFQTRDDMEKALGENEIKQLRINNELFNIVRTPSAVYVFEKACPHMDYPLVKAHINHLEEVACPWHGYRFSLKTGDESSGRCRPLHRLPTRWNDHGQLVLDL